MTFVEELGLDYTAGNEPHIEHARTAWLLGPERLFLALKVVSLHDLR